MVKKRDIEWTPLALADFKEILTYYKKRSPQGYKLVKKAILDTLETVSKSPTAFVKDDLKKPADDAIRTFTVYHTRLVYLVTSKTIVVLRIRHTSREPLEH